MSDATPRELLAIADRHKRLADAADSARAKIRLGERPVQRGGLLGFLRRQPHQVDVFFDADETAAIYDALAIVRNDSMCDRERRAASYSLAADYAERLFGDESLNAERVRVLATELDAANAEVRRLSAALAEQQKQTEVYRNQADDYGRRYGVAFVGAIAKNERAEAAEAALADLRAKVEAHAADVRERHVLRTDHFDSLDADVTCCAVCSVAEDDYPCPDLAAAESLAAALAAAPSGEPNTEENR